MPKLPVLSPKKLIKIFLKEGFIIDHITGSHYVMFSPVFNKMITIPYHIKDLPKGTIHSIIKSSGIELKKFR
jgi:predicted RNA binding protein YcfA (HicA-like mRNA interferase family)